METRQAKVLAGHMTFHGQGGVVRPAIKGFWWGVIVGVAIAWIIDALV